MVALLVLLLAPSLKKLLNSVAYRNRARGKAEIIRAKRSAQVHLQPLPEWKKGKERSSV
ncbi:hypothetical protein [Streptomyces sp. NPDC048295]|uniref:hypothetical protein n=1 Tax=Streptomyces sp. NPDC048295 TaxID=3154617 RepID=UPI00341C3ACF